MNIFQNIQQGITFRNTGEAERGQVQAYHRKPSPLKKTITPHPVDVNGLKPVDRANIRNVSGLIESRFSIGFEIEKNEFHRGAVKEYPLFCGFERDGSCGYEAVTHILPLLGASTWRTKVFDLFVQAERIIDDRYSGSDSRCGGHISVGVEGQSGDEVREKIRGNCGIVLALWAKRLTNTYCGANRRMEASGLPEYNSASGSGSYYSYSSHHKYQTALAKRECLEFRIPSRVQSVKQLIRRYELFYEILDFSYNCEGQDHAKLLKRIEPIIKSMYNGDEVKTKEILDRAKKFREFILTGQIHPSIAQYL